MSWVEVSLDTTPEAIDWVNTLLSQTDYQGNVHIEKYQEPDLQHSPDRHDTDAPWKFTIRLYVPNDGSAGAQIEEMENLFSPLHRTGMATLPYTTVLEAKPTSIAMPQEHSYSIGQRFRVLPPQTSYQPQGTEIPLQLETTRAFGSGLHPTTIISLKLLERRVQSGMNTLDFGSGSGILSVAMAKLGATVLAIDNDSVAVEASEDAVRRNQVESQVIVTRGSLGAGSDLGHWMGGDLTEPVSPIQANACFDLIVANVFARIHLALVYPFRQALRPSGFLIAAGFTADYETEISSAMTGAGFEQVDVERLDEWVAFAYQLKLEG